VARQTSSVFSSSTLASCSTTPGRGESTCSVVYCWHETWPSRQPPRHACQTCLRRSPG
jgi:hypothetical protein